MKTFFLLFALVGILIAPALTQATEVCGSVSGVWDTTGSPYMVNCDVTVPSGQTLEIRPGVQVLFTGHYKFNVNGNLQAIGTEQDSIVFTRAFPTEDSKGWGIRFDNADPACSLAYCIIADFHARTNGYVLGSGGGVYMTQSSPTLIHCTIQDNVADYDGGGVTCHYGCSPRLTDCTIENNSAIGDAGGMLFHTNCNPVVTRCSVRSNTATGTAGGGGVFNAQSTVTMNNCTVFGNRATSGDGGGVETRNGGSTYLDNCVVWNNAAQIGPQVHLFDGTCSVTYSDIQGDYTGTGNIDADPLFVDTVNGDFHLQAGSPCIDSGDPSSPLDPDSTRADMGAFPFLHRLVVTPDALVYGLRDFGADSVQTVSLVNGAGFAIPLASVAHSSSAFVIDTTGLNGAVPPHSTYHLNVTFRADAIGPYNDTLVIVAAQPDSVIRIPLSGEAQILLPLVDSLVIRRGTGNAMQLNWAPITHTISGRPFTPPYYIIYGAVSPSGPFVPIDASPVNSYTHTQFTLPAQYFYRVTAASE